MNFCKIFLLIFFLLPLAAKAEPKVSFSRWEENINLTTTGKNAEVVMLGKIQNLPQNMVLNSFSIGFSKGRDIRIIKVLCDNRAAEYSYQDNVLSIKFPQSKKDNDLLSFYFSYEEKYEKINKSLRQEGIDIPPFVAGATAQVSINFSGDFESATLNPNLTRTANGFIYRTLAPQEGVKEVIKLTASESAWDLIVKTKVSAPKPLDRVTITMPVYFQSAHQKIDNFTTMANIAPVKQATENKSKIFKFETSKQEILIENKARILTGAKYRMMVNDRNTTDYLSITPENMTAVAPILVQIKNDTKYASLPLYARIGKYVHEFIKYDLTYVGKLPSIKEIVANPIGVCTEYANLYTAVARAFGIPTIMVDGAACEYEDCKGHAWNMVFYNGKWIDVDPTWDLMSGIVSSSHIYFNDSGKISNALVESFGNNSINFSTDFEMKSAKLN